MARASARVIWPVIPDAKAMGKKTAIVVNVDAVIAIPTSEVPSFAASFLIFPSSI